MSHVSQNRLDKHAEVKLLNAFNKVLSHIHKDEAMQSFLTAPLSPTEKLMLAKRLGMYYLIKEGYSDVEISRMLHLTRITISRFRYFLDSQGQGFQVAWEIFQTEEIKNEVKNVLQDLAGYAARAAGGRVKPTIF